MAGAVEAKLIITGEDRTSAAFASIASKMARFNSHANMISGMSASAAASVAAAGKSYALAHRMPRVPEVSAAPGYQPPGGALLAAGLGMKTLAYGAGAASIYAGTKRAIKAHADLETALTDLAATTEVSNEKISEARARFEKAAPKLGVTAKEIASVAQSLAASGLDFETSTRAAPDIVRTAKATRANLDEVAGAAGGLLGPLGITVDRLQGALDIVAKGGKFGKFELRDAARELPELGAKARTAGLTGEKGTAALAAQAKIVRDVSGTSSEAATALGRLYDYVFSPTLAKSFRDIGVDLAKEIRAGAAAGLGPLDVVLEQARAKGVDKDPAKLGSLVGADEPRRALAALLREDYRPLRDQILSEAPGTIETDFQRHAKTTTESMARLGAATDTAFGALGEAFAPAVNRAADAMSDFAGWLLESRRAIADNLNEKLGSRPASVPTIEGPFERDPSYGVTRVPDVSKAAAASLGTARQQDTAEVSVQGTVAGEATVNVQPVLITVQVGLDGSVRRDVQAMVERAVAPLKGEIRSGGPGSTGTSMPEARPGGGSGR